MTTQLRLLTFVTALTFTAAGIAAPLMGLYLKSLGASYQQISWILTSVVVTALVANYLWGRFSDRLGRRKPILVAGFWIMALAFLFLSRAANPSFAWASRIFEGIGSAASGTLTLAMLGDMLQNDANKGRRMGLTRGLASAAFAFGSVSGGWIADHFSIAQTLWLCAGIYFLAGLFALLIEEATVKKVSSPSLPVSPSPPLRPSFFQDLPILFLFGVILWIAAHTASASMWPNYMESMGYSKTSNGLFWGLAALVEFPAMWISGAMSDRWGRAALLIVGGLGIMLTNLGYFAFASIPVFLVLIQIIRGIGFGSYTSNAMTFAAERGNAATRGSRSGLFTATASAGSLIGSLLGGTVVQNFGFSTLYVTCAMFALGAAVSFYALYRAK